MSCGEKDVGKDWPYPELADAKSSGGDFPFEDFLLAWTDGEPLQGHWGGI